MTVTRTASARRTSTRHRVYVVNVCRPHCTRRLVTWRATRSSAPCYTARLRLLQPASAARGVPATAASRSPTVRPLTSRSRCRPVATKFFTSSTPRLATALAKVVESRPARHLRATSTRGTAQLDTKLASLPQSPELQTRSRAPSKSSLTASSHFSVILTSIEFYFYICHDVRS